MQTLTPKRRVFQWMSAALFFALPFLEVHGTSLCRIDLDSLTFYLGGTVLRVEELYLLGLAASAGIFLFLVTTQILGRVWCGWGCPQTAFADLVEAGARRLGLRLALGAPQGALWRQALFHLLLLLGGVVVGVGTVSYFVPPRELWARLFAGTLSGWPLGTVVAVAGVLYFDLAFVRRLFCREFCPYGRFQTTLVDPGALTLQLAPAEAERCLHCQACVRACPLGIDIRQGLQIECINCGLCRDACLRVMAPRREAGLIRYRFGVSGQGWRALRNVRVVITALLALALLTAFTVAAGRRTVIGFTVTRSATTASRPTPTGQLVTFFRGNLNNLGTTPQQLTLSAHLPDGQPVVLKGETVLTLAGGEKRQLSLAVETLLPAPTQPLTVKLRVAESQGRIFAEKPVLITNPNL